MKSSSKNLTLKAPMSGILLNLNQVPDQVFADGMVGSGIAIDPVDNKVYAPYNATVTQVHDSKHAIGLKLENNIEMLLHVGIDTVKLKGEGFKTHVKKGDNVSRGDLLLEFDMDYLAVNAKSLITPIVFTNSEKFHTLAIPGDVIQADQNLLGITTDIKVENELTSANANATGNPVTIVNPSGIHARPAALLVQLAKKFESSVELIKEDKIANAKSVISIMGMEIQKDSVVTVKASGIDCEDAVGQITDFLQNFKESHNEDQQSIQATSSKQQEDENTLVGICASSGIAIGQVYQISKIDLPVEKKSAAPDQEKLKLQEAIIKAQEEISTIKKKLESEGNKERAAIFSAHIELLDAPDLLEESYKIINNALNAEYAWKSAYTNLASRFSNLNNELFKARANDIVDVGSRVLKIMLGEDLKSEVEIPANSILIAENLTPSETASLDKDKILAFATTTGGATSHVAILARSMGIPAIAGISVKALDLENGKKILLDADKGTIKLKFTELDEKEVKLKSNKIKEQKQIALSKSFDEAKTKDGFHIEVAANIAGSDEALDASELGCDGVGLMRSEFLFMDRDSTPSVDEQKNVYQRIIDNIHEKRPGKNVIIRTLDVGGDKPLKYLPIPEEENPFLGERGIRVSLNNEKIFREQIRALLQVRPLENVKIMFPMVSELSELLRAKQIVQEEQMKLGVDKVSIGIMIEVPSAALMANTIAPHVDFFSVGANDLTQYTVAVDRGHGKLAHLNDGLNPAVLHLIKVTCDAAKKHGIWTGVCGGIASDLTAVPILIGLGVTELSVSVPVLPLVKEKVREIKMSDCTQMANKALTLASSKQVRELVSSNHN